MFLKKEIKFLLLISKYRLNSSIESDYYNFITQSIRYCGYKYFALKFDKNLIINYKYVANILKKKTLLYWRKQILKKIIFILTL